MQGNCARCGRKVRSEENWLRAFMGEHRGFLLELFYRADETGREGRGAGDVEGKPGRGGATRRERQPRFLQTINAPRTCGTRDAEPTWR
jgi:hypothetical protein